MKMATFNRRLASHDTITSTRCLELRLAIQGLMALLLNAYIQNAYIRGTWVSGKVFFDFIDTDTRVNVPRWG